MWNASNLLLGQGAIKHGNGGNLEIDICISELFHPRWFFFIVRIVPATRNQFKVFVVRRVASTATVATVHVLPVTRICQVVLKVRSTPMLSRILREPRLTQKKESSRLTPQPETQTLLMFDPKSS